MDSKELRDMSIQNARLAVEQFNRLDSNTKPTETKKDSVKKLNIVGIDKCDWSKGGIVVEYVGKNLSYEWDNYMWEITDVLDRDNHTEFILIRESNRESSEERVWGYSVWKVNDEGINNNKKVLLKSGSITKEVLNHPATLIDFIIENSINEYRKSIQI
jgi:hypothetical protein